MSSPLAAIRIASGRDKDETWIALGEGQYVIGRNPGTFLQLTDPSVSRRHVMIGLDSSTNCHYSKNLSDSTPTLVNGIPTGDTPTSLASGDLITLGEVELEYIRPAPEQATADGRLKDTRQRLVPTREIHKE